MSIQKVHFVRPVKSAIVIYAVSGLVIASCSIERFTLLPGIQFSGIGISASDTSATPTPTQPGHPEASLEMISKSQEQRMDWRDAAFFPMLRVSSKIA